MALPYLDKIPSSEQAPFEKAVRALCGRLGIQPEWLMQIMWKESGIDPAKRNPGKGATATGLIQFIESTAKWLGTTTAKLAQMSRIQQLVYVEKYYGTLIGQQSSKPQSLFDLYMLTFSPANYRKPDATVLFRTGSDAYRLNQGLDTAKKGYITVSDVRRFIEGGWSKIPSGSASKPASVPSAQQSLYLTGLVLASGVAWLAYQQFFTSKPAY